MMHPLKPLRSRTRAMESDVLIATQMNDVI